VKQKRTKHSDILRFVDYAAGFQSDVCLPWPFGRNSAGYGHFTLGGKWVLAHRMVCEQAHGPIVGDRNEAAHECGNGHDGCVNPRHLRWKTRAENANDMLVHGTAQTGTKQWMSKLNEDDVRFIRKNRDVLSARAMAARLGVSTSTVRLIIVGHTWKQLSDEEKAA